jgi:prepilin-type N-terminal cleavage/methylation domain-containing protein
MMCREKMGYMKNAAKYQKGFTMIELIAVIAILGLLALLIVPRVANYYSQDAKVSRAKSNMTTVKNAIARYDTEHDSPIDVTKTLEQEKNKLITAIGGRGPYLSAIPDEWANITISTILDGDPANIDITDFSGNVIDPYASL